MYRQLSGLTTPFYSNYILRVFSAMMFILYLKMNFNFLDKELGDLLKKYIDVKKSPFDN